MSEERPDDRRRLIGFVLLASALVMGIVAATIAAGGFDFADETRTTITAVVGAVSLLDAVLGAYFIVSGGRDH